MECRPWRTGAGKQGLGQPARWHSAAEDIEVFGSYREDHGPWAYTTVFAFEKPGHTVEPKANDDESMEICWVPIDDVPNRKLLTAMKTDWPRFAARLDELATAQ